jgi:hypothetical protein
MLARMTRAAKAGPPAGWAVIILGGIAGVLLASDSARDYLVALPLTTWVGMVLAFGIGILELVAAHWIREEESTHPAYKVEKNVWGAVFLGSGLNLLLGPAFLGVYFRLFTSTLIILAAVLSFIFIRYRKNNPLFRVIRLRTQFGPVQSGSVRENNKKASEVAALLRHSRTGGGEPLLSPWAMEELREAIGVPAKSDWVGAQRDLMEQRRSALDTAGDSVDATLPGKDKA